MSMTSPLVERSRIEYARRNCPTAIRDPQKIVKEAIEKHGDKLAVSCSFGSCSVVVLHMALQMKPDIKVVFNNTGVEYPETYEYRDLLAKAWNLNLVETKPEKSFWECVKEYGFPLIRSEYAWKKDKRKQLKPMCCIFLKEKPMAKACREYNIEASLTGLRCAESGVRMFVIAQRGQIYHTKKWGSLWRYHPIAFWTKAEVDQYLWDHQIPKNTIYSKGKDRSGCMPCTGFLNWERQLARANPKMYRIVQKMRGVPILDNYLQWEDRLIATCEPREAVKQMEESS